MTNSNHVLYSNLPERRHLIYNLREQSHNRSLITKTQLLIINEYDFLSSYTDFIQKLLLLDRLMCVAVVALSYFTFMFYYFFHFLLSSCICQLLIKFMMMMMRDQGRRLGSFIVEMGKKAEPTWL